MLVSVTAVALATAGMGAPPAAAVEGLTVDADTTYELRPRDGTVHVTVEARLTNTLPTTTSGGLVRTPYFEAFVIPTFGPVRRPTARSDAGGPLSVDVEEGKRGVVAVVADLEPNLVYGSPQTVTVEFDLPNQPPRSPSVTRVNKGFASWFVYGSGDGGDNTVSIEVPEPFEVTLSRALDVDLKQRGNTNIYDLGSLSVADSALFASATNADGIDGVPLKAAGLDVTIKAWPGDARWRGFATRWTKRGLPALQQLIGAKPLPEELTVAESSRTYQLGFAGFYLPSENLLEVGDVLDERTVLHELSHVWFNHNLFAERWIGEGLAETYANLAMKKLGESSKPPRRVRAGDPGRVPLNAWPPVAVLDPKLLKYERYAYNASHSLIEQLVDEIGVAGMRKVLVAASKHTIPYQGDPPAEETTVVRDWRYLLDLAELVGGAKEIEGTFNHTVLTPAQRPLLVDRFAAQRQLEAVTREGDGWSAPLHLREQLSAWEFDEAVATAGYAQDVLAQAREVVGALDAVDIDVAAALEERYENAADLRDFGTELEQLDDATEEVVAVHERAAGVGTLARVGLIGSDLGMETIEQAITDDELDDVGPLVAAASTTLDGAPRKGAITLVLAALALLVLLVVVLLLRRRRRRAVASTSAPQAHPLPGEDATSDPVPYDSV